MTSKTMAVALAGLIAISAAPAAGQVTDDVANTKHNLSAGGPTGATLVDYGEICVYCHTPHGGQVDAPLWNRNFSTATYQMYTSSTIDMTMDGQPTGISKACLSCHDGTIGLDVIINPPNSYAGTVPGTTPGTNTMPSGGFTFLDTDLRNDHPISVVYDETADTKFNAKSSILAAGLKLYTDPASAGEKVQCATCHNPHQKGRAAFLRIDNSASALCKTCHIK
ncbi:MAG: cytochrome C [Gemmatimonadetes bacterium]|nr:MAG: cytochrome C [Gemmatimonadota bacterium]